MLRYILAGWKFFIGWEGWMELYSGWMGVCARIFCVGGQFLWVGGGDWRYILGVWGWVVILHG